ncbi:hypothetical protein BWI93_21745 [Siphonobacter sp. BAB-5385]|nr:hypothetical protein BWI93_21745 [Siphonobacter sp. BAB-5385]
MQGVLAAKLTFGYYGNVMQILQNHEVLFNNMAIECGRYEKRQIFLEFKNGSLYLCDMPPVKTAKFNS